MKTWVDSDKVLATAEVVLPAGSEAHAASIFLRHGGRILAMARVEPGTPRRISLELQAAFEGAKLPHATCEFWAVIHSGGLTGPYPAFGDQFRLEQTQTSTKLPALYMPESPEWFHRPLSSPDNLLTIHYHRYDADYDNVGIWTWDAWHQRMPRELELMPVGEDDFGLLFQLDIAAYGIPTHPKRIGLVPRMAGDWSRKDSDDRFWEPPMGREVYLVGGSPVIYTSRPRTDPHIAAVHIDTVRILHVELSHAISTEVLASAKLTVRAANGNELRVAATRILFPSSRGLSRVVEVELMSPLDVVTQSYLLEMEGFGGPVAAVPRQILDDPALFYDKAARLGCNLESGSTVFRVFAPTAFGVSVVLYNEATGSAGRRELPMVRGASGIWTCSEPGNLEGLFYTYRVISPAAPDGTEATDIYATNAVDSSRRARITFDEPVARCLDAPASTHDFSPVDAIIWEVHVRDFSVSSNSGMQHKGKYLAFAESGTQCADHPGVCTGLEHLVELGVTHVQLLPVQDHDNEESAPHYDWGYMTMLFNSPEGAYASSPFDDSRVREFKVLVEALHARGIGVILDVVYNHTSGAAPFNTFVPGYYYRHNPDGSLSNGSGTGNEFRTEAPMGRKYFIETLCRWVEHYDVDGFRFDLMALLDNATMREAEQALRAIKPGILLYGEPWQAAPSPLARPMDKRALAGTGIGAFNDDFRNAVKGSPEGDDPGFAQNGSHKFAVEHALSGSHRLWAPSPAHSINYLTCHDNLVLYDKLEKSMPRADHEAMLKAARLAYFILLTSQGVPFLHAGCEFFRTKFGDHNSYQSPDAINQIDWSLKAVNRQLFDYVRSLIAIRKAHPVFRLRTAQEAARRIAFHFTPTGDTILATLDGNGLDGESWRYVALVLNAHATDARDIPLPRPVGMDEPWQVVFDPNGNEPYLPATLPFVVPPRSAILLAIPAP